MSFSWTDDPTKARLWSNEAPESTLRTNEKSEEEWAAKRVEDRIKRRQSGPQDNPDAESSRLLENHNPESPLPTHLTKNARASSGHWRKLPPGHKGTDQAGNETSGKTWVNKVKRYAAAAAAMAPVQIARQAVGVPESGAEGFLEAKLLKKPGKAAFKEGLRTAAGRFGGGAAVATATGPLFFSGVKDLESDDKKRKAKGTAKVLASGLIFKGVKGAAEYAAREGGKAAVKGGRAQAMIGLPAGLAAAYGLSRTGKKKSDKDKYLTGAAYGAATGAATGFAEPYAKNMGQGVSKAKLLRLAKAKGMSRASVGMLGGAASAYMYDRFIKPALKKKEKKGGASGLRPEFRPYPHQERAINRLMQHRALVMAHGTGTGKTFTSIAGFERLRSNGQATKALIVVPAGLKKNFADSIEKFTTSSMQVIGPKGSTHGVPLNSAIAGPDYTIVSYAMFRRDPDAMLALTGADTLVFDEYHRVRNPSGKTYKAAMSVRDKVKNFMGMTGSVLNNDPAEIVPLMNLSAGQEVMRPSEFKSRYMVRYARSRGFFGGSEWLETMKDLPELKERVSPHVDYVSTEDVGKDFPRRNVEEVEVPMSKEQRKMYRWAMKDVGPITAWKIRQNLPVNQREASNVFGKIIKARQASNALHPFKKDMDLAESAAQSPKVTKLLDDAQKHLAETADGKVVLYSNLVRGGVDVLTAGLKARGIDHAVFVGKGRQIGDSKITDESRNRGVDEFKAGKKKVIVLSGAGAEGLSFDNATMFQSLDGHFNPERTRQAEARARRIKGLSHRKPENREVKVKRYFSVHPKKGKVHRFFTGKRKSTTDQWIHTTAKRKHELNEQMRGALRRRRSNPEQPMKESGFWSRFRSKKKTSPAPAVPTVAPTPAVTTQQAPQALQRARRPSVWSRLKSWVKKRRGAKKPTKYKRRWRNLKTGDWDYEY